MEIIILLVFLLFILLGYAFFKYWSNDVEICGGLELFKTEFKSRLSMPRKYKRLDKKVCYIKKQILKPLPFDAPMIKSNDELPDGLCVIEGPFKDAEIDKLHENLEHIFGHLSELGLPYEYNKIHGNTFLFDNVNVQKWGDVITELQRVDPYTASAMTKLVGHVREKLDIPSEVIESQLMTTIIKYDQDQGIKLHLDSIRRASGGPIVTMNIGPDFIYYDLVSIRGDRKDPSYRVRVDKNELVVMDGEMRLHYAHALPYGFHYSRTKYTIVLLFDKFRVIETKYSDYFKTDVTKSVKC